MTDIDRRLAAAFAQREREMQVDDDAAWQRHVQMAQGMSHAGVIRRWRAPALVAAAVAGLGLVGGILGQSGIVGGGTVNPAGPGTYAIAPVSSGTSAPATWTSPQPSSTAPASVRTASSPAGPPSTGPASSGAGSGSAGAAGGSAGAAIGSTGDQPNSSAVVPGTPTAAPGTPRTSGRSAAATTAPEGSGTWLTSPPMTSSPPGPRVSSVAQRLSRAASYPGRTAATSSAEQAAGAGDPLMDLTSTVPCGEVLPQLDKELPGLTLSPGPGGDVVNADQEALPVLAIGFVLVSDDGRVASMSGADARITTGTAPSLPTGRSPKDQRAPLTPTGVCSTVSPGRIWQVGQYDPPVFPVPAVPGLHDGIYRAVSVVLIGRDLAHAHAYQAGGVWQLSSG